MADAGSLFEFRRFRGAALRLRCLILGHRFGICTPADTCIDCGWRL